LPGSDDGEAVFDDFIKGTIGVDHGISLFGKRITHLGFHAVRGGSLEVSVIGSRFDARRARGIAYLQEEQPSSGWGGQRTQNAKNRNVPQTVDHKVVARLEATRAQHITAKALGIIVDPLLAKVLQCLSRSWIPSATRDLGPKKVAETYSTPPERLGDRGADGRLAAADLAREADK
jgi:hypothetical protein